ncbi:MAG: hypothetical protein V2J11_00140 [Desulfofustis sp.]|nr:hypothetical protein [Desulfofustis sp.]
MRPVHTLITVVLVSCLIFSCDSSSSDKSATTGGAGDVATPTATTVETSSKTTETTAASSGTVTLDAFDDFSCSGNWTDRDGALGLAPYSGSGSCTASFPGASGRYRMTVKIVTEFDGMSPYKVSINGQTIKEGEYPLSSPLHCDCPLDDWRSVCPDRSATLDCGTHSLKTGDVIGFWGDDVYPCGDSHGAYAKWYSMTFTKVN